MMIAMPKIDNIVDSYSFSWNRPADEYPESVYNVLWISLKDIALDWIEENLPMAWYKPMFQ